MLSWMIWYGDKSGTTIEEEGLYLNLVEFRLFFKTETLNLSNMDEKPNFKPKAKGSKDNKVEVNKTRVHLILNIL